MSFLKMSFVLISLLLLNPLINLFADESATAEVESLFEKCDQLEKAFDAGLVSCYSDDAVIENTRVYPDGKERKLSLTGAQYKALLIAALPLAKQRNDTSSYQDLVFTESGDEVVLTGQRYSNLKKYLSPIEVHFRKDSLGQWKIVKELTESQP